MHTLFRFLAFLLVSATAFAQSVENEIHIRTPEELGAAQRHLALELWGTNGPPTEVAALKAVVNPLYSVTNCHSSIALKLATYPATNYCASPLIWQSLRFAGRWIILHQGHGASWPNSQFPLALQVYLNAGYNVAGVAMPLDPHNVTKRPLSDFIGPTVVVVNTIRELGYTNIIMSGLSGGGWTTTLAAAADERILAAYPTAGSLPLSCPVLRDYEQLLPGLSETYEDLYIMACSGGRRFKQIHHIWDACCFTFEQYSATRYADRVNYYGRTAGGGNFSLVWTDQTIHQFEPWIIRQEILPELLP